MSWARKRAVDVHDETAGYIDPLDLAPCQGLRLFDHRSQRVSVIGVARQRLGRGARTGRPLARRLVVAIETLQPNS